MTEQKPPSGLEKHAGWLAIFALTWMVCVIVFAKSSDVSVFSFLAKPQIAIWGVVLIGCTVIGYIKRYRRKAREENRTDE